MYYFPHFSSQETVTQRVLVSDDVGFCPEGGCLPQPQPSSSPSSQSQAEATQQRAVIDRAWFPQAVGAGDSHL